MQKKNIAVEVLNRALKAYVDEMLGVIENGTY